MVQKKALVALLGLLAVLVMAVPAMAENLASAQQTTDGIVLEDWKGSSLNEKYAFLLGMATMVEMEKYWRANHNSSLIDQWAAGFAGPTFKQIVDKVDGYAMANPDKDKQYLLEVLWYEIAAPEVSDNEVK